MYEKHLVKLKDQSREKARKEFDEMMFEWKRNGDLSVLQIQSLSVEGLVKLFEKDARFIALKNAVERENKMKLFLLEMKRF